MRINKGKRDPRTLHIIELRKRELSINKIAELVGCTRQWVFFCLKRDGDPLEQPVDKSMLTSSLPQNTIKVEDKIINEQGDDIADIVRQGI